MSVRDFLSIESSVNVNEGKEKLSRIVVRWTKMFQLKVSSIRLRGTRQFPRRKCRTKVGQLRFQESGGGGGECIKRGLEKYFQREGGGRKV